MQKTAAEIIDAMGGRYFERSRRAARRPSSRAASSFTKWAAPSWATIPKKSVTNSFGQCWDMKNLFITDGATLCSNADKNPDAHHHGAGLARVRSHAGPHEEEGAVSMDRRTTIKWMFAAAAAVPSLQRSATRREPLARDVAAGQAGYGTDPDLMKEWKPGGPWPLTLERAARASRPQALCDLIIPGRRAFARGVRRRRRGFHRRMDQRAVSAAARRPRASCCRASRGSTRKRRSVSARHSPRLTERRERHRRRHLLAGKAAPQFAQGGEVLREVPRSHRRRLLHHARRHEGHRLHGQRAAGEIRRAAARGAEEGRAGLKPVNGEATPARRRLPLRRILLGAFALPWQHRGELARATGLPIARRDRLSRSPRDLAGLSMTSAGARGLSTSSTCIASQLAGDLHTSAGAARRCCRRGTQLEFDRHCKRAGLVSWAR